MQKTVLPTFQFLLFGFAQILECTTYGVYPLFLSFFSLQLLIGTRRGALSVVCVDVLYVELHQIPRGNYQLPDSSWGWTACPVQVVAHTLLPWVRVFTESAQSWMLVNKLKLNPDITKFLLTCNELQISKYISVFPNEFLVQKPTQQILLGI